ncbi:unnamed protein product [Rotaria sordida]|uniref:Uncharacterized protein n=2 Tax=Rotaria sordida TaxID=392033 RepID=A0A815GBX7_9BILA|nr:unnamed protein product [Rotaria sordida]
MTRDGATCDGRHAFDGGAGFGRLFGGGDDLGRIVAGCGLASGGLGLSGFGRGFGGSLIFIRGDDLNGHLCLCEKH